MSGEADLAGLLAGDAQTVLLAQAGTATEARLIHERIAVAGGKDRRVVSLGAAGIPVSVLGDPDVRLIPVRVAWLPEERGGRRAARVADLMPGHDPYHPSESRQRRILARQPDRATVLVGEPATVGALRQRWLEATGGGEDAGLGGEDAAGPGGDEDATGFGGDAADFGDDAAGFAGFVARRATLALDRAEYRLRGPRYKTPSLVKEEILASRRFRSGLRELRGEASASAAPASAASASASAASLAAAGEILDELVAGWSRRLIDIMPNAGRLIFQRGFDPQIDYDEAQVERMRAAMQRHPTILLWSHRSNLDTLVLAAALQEKGLPPAHLFAGINMAFGPMGAIMRRAGVIFIRRSIGEDRLYRYVLREYIGYVLEKRFNLSWSIEGTRSRTGKMLPPRLGLLSYAADAYTDRRVDDVLLQPVSITFDQLHEVAEYAEYARGGQKKPEGFGWLYGFIKAQGARHYGKVYVRFGEPVALSTFLGPPAALDAAARRLALQKAAFEVAWRINQSMPVTATAVITTILLAMQGAALTFEQIRLGVADALAYLSVRDIPVTASLRALAAPEPVRATLDALRQGGLVSYSGDGREPVWLIEPDQQLAATFYRNSLVHFVLDTALCELAVLRAAEAGADPVGAFWAEIAWLRDLLKFEFYFQDREEHRRAVREEMDRHDPAWEQRLRSGPDEAESLLSTMRPLVSHVVVRPFVEAYRIVADVLATDDVVGPADSASAGSASAGSASAGSASAGSASAGSVDDAEVIRRALGLGRQYVAQRRLRSSESVSALLFSTALQLARNRGLLENGAEAAVRRAAFLAELRDLLRRLDRIENMAIRRYIQDAVTAPSTD